ncbi:hypothetical protein ACO1NC_14140, partial [Staphylococcus aureus]
MTPFVGAFARERTRLEAAGEEPRAVWAALEQMNLGRLRIAAKGVTRDADGGDALRPVSTTEQRNEGL